LAFENSGLTTITIPPSVTLIEATCFLFANSLKEIHCNNPNLPRLGIDYFLFVGQTACKLYVPKASINAYKTADQWKDFYNILAGT
jgi:hypothetical protein